MQNHILIVDDESAIRDMLRMALENCDFKVTEANNAKLALESIQEQRPNLILLDWMMPGLSGLEFAKRLTGNDKNNDIGIIMLTAKDGEEHQIKALDFGVDDFISKPFSIRKLISRINAVLRRIRKNTSELNKDVITQGVMKIDLTSHNVFINSETVKLSPTEFRLLHFFMTHTDRVFSRSMLLDQVWGEQVYVEERTVDVHIRRLRKILEQNDCAYYIQTIHSFGYRFSTINNDAKQ